MSTKKHNKPLTGEIVGNEHKGSMNKDENEKTPETNEGVDENRAVSIKHYLLPALLDEKRDSSWSKEAMIAALSVVVVLAVIIALYMYGASLA